MFWQICYAAAPFHASLILGDHVNGGIVAILGEGHGAMAMSVAWLFAMAAAGYRSIPTWSCFLEKDNVALLSHRWDIVSMFMSRPMFFTFTR